MDDDEFNAEALAKRRAEKAAATRAAQEAAMAEDPELAAILAETKTVQKDTLQSTQNSVRTLKETITVADKTSETLKQQGEQLDRIEEKAQKADVNATESYKDARELHKYKGLLPVSLKNAFTGSKKKQEDERLQKTTRQLDKQEARIDSGASRPSLSPRPKSPAKEHAKDSEYDQTERDINDNLDEMSAGLDHLQVQASSMGEEIQRQNVSVKRIDATTTHTDYTLNSANRKLQEFM